MASTPSFVGTPRIGFGQLTTGDTVRDSGPGSVVTIFTAGANGSRLDRIDIMSAGSNGSTPPANTVALWLFDGTTYRLMREVAVSVPVPAAGTAGFQTSLTYPFGLVLPSGWSLRATVRASDKYNVIAYGGDF